MATDKLKGPATAGLSIRVSSDNYNDPEVIIGQNTEVKQDYLFGTGSNQADKVYSTELSIAALATTTLVLDDASLLDIFNLPVSFGSIKLIRIQHKTKSSSESITLAGTFMDSAFASALFSRAYAKGGFFNNSDGDAGYAVGGGETITLENTDAAQIATVSIELIGV